MDRRAAWVLGCRSGTRVLGCSGARVRCRAVWSLSARNNVARAVEEDELVVVAFNVEALLVYGAVMSRAQRY